MKLIIGTAPDTLEFYPWEILGISEVLPAAADPDGRGTYDAPFTMNTPGKWLGAATRANAGKRVFYLVGGRLVHRRTNRAEGKFSDYLTDCGTFTEANVQRLGAALAAKTAAVGAAAAGAPQRRAVPAGASRDEFNAKARWYKAADDQEFTPLGPSYADLKDILEGRDPQDAGGTEQARAIRAILKGTMPNAPAFMAMTAAAWFIGEVQRYPRMIVCGLALLDLIETRKNSSGQLDGASPYTFRKALYRTADGDLSHPMSGQGTVKAAAAARGQVDAFAKHLGPATPKITSAVPPLSKLMQREAEILIRWVGARLRASHPGTAFSLVDGGDVRLAADEATRVRGGPGKEIWRTRMNEAFRARAATLDLLLV